MLPRMPQLDLIDDTWVVATPSAAAGLIADRSRWADWWPGLRLAVSQDRGWLGIRWRVTGAYPGSMEIWIEPSADGCVLHYYLRVDRVAGPLSDRAAAREIRRRRIAGRRALWGIKDELERGRSPGEPA